MKHIAITEYGSMLGIRGARLVIKERGTMVAEHALSRIKSVLIAKSGVSVSSNCVIALTARGIKLFVTDFKGEIVSCLYDVYSHGTVSVRKNQFDFVSSSEVSKLASILIQSKLRGQYAVLKYFSKYKTETYKERPEILSSAAEKIKVIVEQIRENQFVRPNWKERLMGYEGTAARIYWQALVDCHYFNSLFKGRRGRGAQDITNKALNYGYAILSTIVSNAIINAGLELYVGILHSSVPGKPALLLDLMEEYRAVVVDKAVIKIRFLLDDHKDLNADLKKRLIKEIYISVNRRHLYNGRKIKLESIIQRQLYRLAATFCKKRKYKSITHKW